MSFKFVSVAVGISVKVSIASFREYSANALQVAFAFQRCSSRVALLIGVRLFLLEIPTLCEDVLQWVSALSRLGQCPCITSHIYKIT